MYKQRRTFLNLTATIFISLAAPLFSDIRDKKYRLQKGVFLHGVASGDPQKDKVIIWTRVTSDENSLSIATLYEVSKDKNFKDLYRSELVYALKENDYTIKVDLQELQADTQYYYRFKTLNSISAVGKTKTLPIETEKITLALFSCANYTNGYFNAYNNAASFKQIDVVVHLGDYIYEYGMLDKNSQSAYGTKNAKKIGRELPKNNANELFTLEDYRLRYALYRSDPDLQNLHKKFAFILIWDDHEVVNDAYRNKNDKKRRENAIKAYYEWLPIRPSDENEYEKIYRSFHFGKLFSLYMLDTRLIAREKQLNYNDYMSNNNEFNLKKFQTDLKESTSKLLGKKQFDWLKKELQNSSAKWQILGQQVRVAPSHIPLEVVKLQVQYQNAKNIQEKELIKEKIFTSFEEIGRIKARSTLKDTSLTPEDKKRLNMISLPYNLDAWDGYPNERENLYSLLRKYANATIILSGDTHYSWSNKLLDKNNNILGIEIGVTSVSSPGLEEDYNLEDKTILKQLENSIHIFDENSLYNNQTDRGYLIMEITDLEIKTHWRYVDTINSRDYKILNHRNTTMRLASRDKKYIYRVQ